MVSSSGCAGACMNVPETLSLRSARPSAMWPLFADTIEKLMRFCACTGRESDTRITNTGIARQAPAAKAMSLRKCIFLLAALQVCVNLLWRIERSNSFSIWGVFGILYLYTMRPKLPATNRQLQRQRLPCECSDLVASKMVGSSPRRRRPARGAKPASVPVRLTPYPVPSRNTATPDNPISDGPVFPEDKRCLEFQYRFQFATFPHWRVRYTIRSLIAIAHPATSNS